MKKNIIIGAIVIFIILAALVLFPWFQSSKAPFPEVKTPGKEEAPKIILPKILYNLAGVIQKLEKDTVLLEATIPQLNEAGEPIQKTETRKVLITTATKFTQLTFLAGADPKKKTPVETAVTFKELKAGDYVEVISNQDISQKEEFTAIQIRILPKSF